MPNTVYYSLYEDETAAVCNTLIPAAHTLESWGDARATDGTVSIVQPLISPLWGGIMEADLLAAFVGEGKLGAHELVRRYWRSQASASGKGPLAGLDNDTVFNDTWERWLADGVIPGTASNPEAKLAVDGGALTQALTPLLSRSKAGMEIAFAVDPKVYDGRFANNAWLQELADPITKLTWDNVAMISGATAKSIGVEDWDIVEILYRDRRVEAPVLIVPGHADDVVTVPLGYGRDGSENVARGVGFNANALRTSDAPWFDRGVTVNRTGARAKLAITQDHWSMAPDGRHTPGSGRRRPPRRGPQGGLEVPRGAGRASRPPADHPRAGRLQHPDVQVGHGHRPQQVHGM